MKVQEIRDSWILDLQNDLQANLPLVMTFRIPCGEAGQYQCGGREGGVGRVSNKVDVDEKA